MLGDVKGEEKVKEIISKVIKNSSAIVVLFSCDSFFRVTRCMRKQTVGN